jgi:hypothetical protein
MIDISEGYKSEAIEAPNCLGFFYNDYECEDCPWREECRDDSTTAQQKPIAQPHINT